jgi:hypothetical protein
MYDDMFTRQRCIASEAQGKAWLRTACAEQMACRTRRPPTRRGRMQSILEFCDNARSGRCDIVAASKGRSEARASMRFPVLLAAAAITGAVAVVSLKTFFPQQNTMLMAMARSAATSAARLPLSDLNPIQSAYNYVAREISSPRSNADLNFQSAPGVVGEIKVPPLGIKPLDLGGFSSHSQRLRSTTMRCSRGGVTIPCD